MSYATPLALHSANAATYEANPSSVSDATPIVFVVDDDVSVRRSLELLIDAAGWQVETFASALEFLASPRPVAPSCLVLDVWLPGLNGLDLQERISADRVEMPIIFVTGHGDVPMTRAGHERRSDRVPDQAVPRRGAVGGHRAGARAKPSRTRLRSGDAGSSRTASLAQRSRTRSHGVGGRRTVEQAGCRRARHQRDHGEGAPRPRDAEDGRCLVAAPGRHGRKARPESPRKGLAAYRNMGKFPGSIVRSGAAPRLLKDIAERAPEAASSR